MTTDLVPIGKYKGQPVTALAQDRSYCDWLTQQSWFVQKFPELHTLIINNFGEPTETPEHNRLQLRFLDKDFRLRCMRLALQYYAPKFFDVQLCNRVFNNRYDDSGGYSQARFFGAIKALGKPEFECDGIDVQWVYSQLFLEDHCSVSREETFLVQDREHFTLALLGTDGYEGGLEYLQEHVFGRTLYEKLQKKVASQYPFPDRIDDMLKDAFERVQAAYADDEQFFVQTTSIHEYAWGSARLDGSIAVECKPVLGDDYPAVLRFMKDTKHRATRHNYSFQTYLLVIDQFSAKGGTLDQVKTMFRNSDFLLLTLAEIEATTPLEYYPDFKGLRPAHEVVTWNNVVEENAIADEFQ